METHFNEQDRYYRAQKKVEEIKGFYGHLVSYIVVNAGLLTLNLVTSPQELWFFWPLLGWGVGLFFHAMRAFDWSPFFSKEWEARKLKQFIQEELEKSKNMHQSSEKPPY